MAPSTLNTGPLTDRYTPLQLIIRGGENISPIELDSAILALPGVAEAVTFGVPDAKYGEKLWAMVVLKEGAKEDAEGLKNALQNKVAKVSKAPRSSRFDWRRRMGC